MKKSLSLLVAITMVFSMFASVAFAADKAEPTQQEKFDALKELGIFTGFPDGSAGLDKNMTRAQFAKVLTVGTGLEENAAASKYSDVSASHWAKGFIGAVTEAGLMQGKGNNKFDPNGNVTIQELAKTLVLSLGLEQVEGATVEGASAWAAGYVQAALDAKIIPSLTNYNVPAKRGQLVDSIYNIVADQVTVKSAEVIDEKTVKVTFSDDQTVTKTLDTALELGKATKVSVEYNGKTYEVEVTFEGAAVTKAEAVGVKKVKATFAAAVDTAKVTFAIKNGSSIVSVVKTTWNDAKTEATLETAIALPTGDLSVVASGVKFATGKDSAKVTVAPERIETVSIDDNGFRTTVGGTTVEVAYKLLNQYGEEVSASLVGGVVATPSIGNVTNAATIVADKKAVIANIAADKTELNLTIVDQKFAKYASKTVKVQQTKTVNEVTLGALELPTGKTAFEAKGVYTLPYTAKDQFGNDVTLADLTGLTFISSDSTNLPVANVVLTADKKKLQVTLGDFSGPKSFTLTVLVNGSGKSSKVEFTANGKKSIAEVTLVAPSTQFGANEADYKVEIQAKDQYGNALTGKEISDLATAELSIISGNQAVFVYDKTVVDGEKAYALVDGAAKGTAALIATVKSNGKSSSIQLNVVDAKYAATLTLKPSVTKAVKGAAITIKADFTEQYGGALNSGSTAVVKVKTDNANFTTATVLNATNQTVSGLHDTGVVFTAANADAATVVTFELYNGADLVDSKSVTLTSAKNDEALTYEVGALGTLYTVAGQDTTSAYAAEVKVSGKDASGNAVALKSDAILEVTATDSSILAVNGVKIAGKGTADADTSVNVTIAKQDGTTALVVAPVKLSKAAPVATAIAFKKGDDVVTKVKVASGAKLDTAAVVEVKDQYGKTALSGSASTYVTAPNGSVTRQDLSTYTFNGASGDKYKVTATFADKTVTIEVEIQ